MGSNIVKHHPQVTHGSIPVLGFLQGSLVGEATPETEKKTAKRHLWDHRKKSAVRDIANFYSTILSFFLIEYF
jgi:hypothetical protein